MGGLFGGHIFLFLIRALSPQKRARPLSLFPRAPWWACSRPSPPISARAPSRAPSPSTAPRGCCVCTTPRAVPWGYVNKGLRQKQRAEKARRVRVIPDRGVLGAGLRCEGAAPAVRPARGRRGAGERRGGNPSGILRFRQERTWCEVLEGGVVSRPWRSLRPNLGLLCRVV